MVLLLTFLPLLLCVAGGPIERSRRKRFHMAIPLSKIANDGDLNQKRSGASQLSVENCTEIWVEQPVDHFAENNTDDLLKWKQRVFVYDGFVDPDVGPRAVFFYTGNEADVRFFLHFRK